MQIKSKYRVSICKMKNPPLPMKVQQYAGM